MIEIIENGTKQIRKCKACGCKFSFEKEDVKRAYHHSIFYFYYVICPQCKEKIELGGKEDD